MKFKSCTSWLVLKAFAKSKISSSTRRKISLSSCHFMLWQTSGITWRWSLVDIWARKIPGRCSSSWSRLFRESMRGRSCTEISSQKIFSWKMMNSWFAFPTSDSPPELVRNLNMKRPELVKLVPHATTLMKSSKRNHTMRELTFGALVFYSSRCCLEPCHSLMTQKTPEITQLPSPLLCLSFLQNLKYQWRQEIWLGLFWYLKRREFLWNKFWSIIGSH